MWSLVKKESREVGLVASTAIVILSAVWLSTQEHVDVLLAPKKDAFMAVTITAAVAGMALALVQLGGERWLGTRGILVHRGTGFGVAFRAKALVGAACAWAVGFVPLLVFAVAHAFGPNGGVVQWLRVAEYAAAACSAWSAYAIVAWVVELRRPRQGEIVLLVAAAPCALLALGPASSAIGADVLSTGVAWIGANALVALFFGTLASRAFAELRDPDFPLARRDLLTATALSPWLWLLVAGGMIALAQRKLVGAIVERHPRIVAELGDGRVVLARTVDGRSVVVVARGELESAFALDPSSLSRSVAIESVPAAGNWIVRAGENAPRAHDDGTGALVPWQSWLGLGVDFDGFDSPGESGAWARWLFLDRDAGVLRLFGLRVESYFRRDTASELAEPPPFERTFLRADGQHFGAPMIVRNVGGVACIADLTDATLWRVEPKADRLLVSALTLPNGPDAGLVREALLCAKPGAGIALGERTYVFDGTGFVEREVAPAYSLSVGARDGLSLDVRVARHGSDEVLIDATFEPTAEGQRALTVAAHALELLRPPLAAVVSFVGPPWSAKDFREKRWMRSPLLAGGSRPWLLAVVLTLSAGCVVLVVRRQRALGHSPEVIALAAIATACFGPWAVLWLAHLESRAAPGSMPRGRAEPAPEPLIQTA